MKRLSNITTILAATALFALVGCGADEDDSGSDAGDDTTMDDATMDDATMDDATMDDATMDDTGTDTVSATGTVSGMVFYNGEPVTGALTIALYVDAYTAEATPAAIEVIADPVFQYAYSLEAPVGPTYVVAAWLNLDGSEPLTVESSDLFGVTEGSVGFSEGGDTVDNINVEVR